MTSAAAQVVSRGSLYYNSDVAANIVAAPAPPRGFFRVLWRALRQLFHETTAAIFGVFALAAASSALRAWRGGAPRWIVAMPLAYAAMMMFFCVTSFRMARRIR
ncbi:MAG TPA: hypothetical protein VFO34_08650 [Candidatus Acidoferrales bacterium]|nr:hypothetical protein [Candidatus Acidoferrales bacterium]